MPEEPATFPGSSAFPASISASEAEKSARAGDASSPRAPKPRSCATCRTRKVRCDKKSPCSNCRRANIACVLPNKDQQPRWARRFRQEPPGDVMNRLRSLENLVKQLSSQLEEANAGSPTGVSPNVNPSGTGQQTEIGHRPEILSANPGKMESQFGRLVVGDPNHSRYVGSGFWSRVNDELNELKMDTQDLVREGEESSDDEVSFGQTPSTQELERSPLDRHSFIFKHNLTSASPDLREFHPLPSQIPFLLDVFSENVNSVTQCVHMPTVTKMIRELRGDMTRLTPTNEALVFSIYYAAVTSMEDDEIAINFGCTKQELNLKYRLGLEHALAKADFLNTPDLVLVQAFINFLALLRRYDSPRFVWMMTGLAIRMAISLGIHRDGSKFAHLKPYDVEMRRRVWWCLCMLDVRTSEDQGTEFTITEGSFDTRIPSNINDTDITPDANETPSDREGLTDMSFARMSAQTVMIVREMMAHNSRSSSIEQQSRLIDEIYKTTEQSYLQHSSESNIAYWVSVTIARLVTSKMTLFVYLPYLFSSPGEQLTSEIRAKLLNCAIEVAEYNHALNAEQACRQWRWTYQTYVHWHAIVYILIEICRLPWSPLAERGWISLHSPWLIPPKSHMKHNMRFCFPLQKLMLKAQNHRQGEIVRLRENPQAVAELEEQHTRIAQPSSPELTSGKSGSSLDQWHRLLAAQDLGVLNHTLRDETGIPGTGSEDTNSGSTSASAFQGLYSTTGSNPSIPSSVNQAPKPLDSSYGPDGRIPDQGNDTYMWFLNDEVTAGSNTHSMDMNMELDDIDWYGWVDSVKGMQWDGGLEGGI